MAKKQFYGISYPFTTQDSENYFVDLNSDYKEKVRSILMHVVFTPKGQKIRDPEFGTDLIKYIFEPDDSVSWSNIKNEVSDVVKKHLSNVIVNNISVLQDEDEISAIYVRLDYTITNGIREIKDSLVTKI